MVQRFSHLNYVTSQPITPKAVLIVLEYLGEPVFLSPLRKPWGKVKGGVDETNFDLFNHLCLWSGVKSAAVRNVASGVRHSCAKYCITTWQLGVPRHVPYLLCASLHALCRGEED